VGSLEFGIVRIGQIWCVVGAEGSQLGFPIQELAVAAAEQIASGHRKRGADCNILVQDDAGQLRPLEGSRNGFLYA
jgi:hypothetical protein